MPPARKMDRKAPARMAIAPEESGPRAIMPPSRMKAPSPRKGCFFADGRNRALSQTITSSPPFARAAGSLRPQPRAPAPPTGMMKPSGCFPAEWRWVEFYHPQTRTPRFPEQKIPGPPRGASKIPTCPGLGATGVSKMNFPFPATDQQQKRKRLPPSSFPPDNPRKDPSPWSPVREDRSAQSLRLLRVTRGTARLCKPSVFSHVPTVVRIPYRPQEKSVFKQFLPPRCPWTQNQNFGNFAEEKRTMRKPFFFSRKIAPAHQNVFQFWGIKTRTCVANYPLAPGPKVFFGSPPETPTSGKA